MNGIHTNGLTASTSHSNSIDFGDDLPNGHAPTNGIAGSSSSSSTQGDIQLPPLQPHDDELISHIFLQGWQSGHYSDIGLHVHQTLYRLHSIVLSRSPLFAHLMHVTPYPTNGQPRTLYLNLEAEPDVTPEVTLGYLYSSRSIHGVHPQNARGVLAAACLLGGLDDLCQYAYDLCRTTIGASNIDEWLDFLERTPAPTETSAPHNVFGPYAEKLREDVFECLVCKLPATLKVTHGRVDPEGRKELLKIFSRVPFELFKSVVESSSFQIGTDQQRFKFAKEAIEARRSGIAKGAEENVVLAFGGGVASGGAVHITRKVRKRALWKVSNQTSA
ncbi:hypothetical protein DL96DRAFT_1792618 [Flagelloscypha sp. PMI_526]|nr:hypothetical protein DL96DRAFT_1792618 [Flagelloscypha sp. PMI_526]